MSNNLSALVSSIDEQRTSKALPSLSDDDESLALPVPGEIVDPPTQRTLGLKLDDLVGTCNVPDSNGACRVGRSAVEAGGRESGDGRRLDVGRVNDRSRQVLKTRR